MGSWEKSPAKDEHAVKRLAWAMEYKDWTKEDFEGVIFSDKCIVEKSKDDKGICVRHMGKA